MSSIDVAIPNYNYGRYLRRCVESVLGQDVDGIRVLIIDNASTDDSTRIARELASEDARVELCLRANNAGPHASFNAGIEWARGDYFAILCSDDALAKGALARAIQALEQHPGANLAFGRTHYLRQDSGLPQFSSTVAAEVHYLSGTQFLERFCDSGRNPVDGPMAIVRTKTQKQVGYYRPELPHTDDAEMWMRFACRGGAVEIDAVQAIVRVHSASQSAVLDNVQHWNVEMEAAFRAFFKGAGAQFPGSERLYERARHSLSDRAYWGAVAQYIRGESNAPELMAFAKRLRPLSAILPPFGYLLRRRDVFEKIAATLSRVPERAQWIKRQSS
jgi:glycosyltransferase involved in cell wall biosynthesis